MTAPIPRSLQCQADRSAQPGSGPRSILMVSTGLGVGGSELQLCQLAFGLQARGWRVTVVSMQEGGFYKAWLEQANIDVIELPVGRLPRPRALQALAQLIRQRRPMLVHTQAFRANLWARATALALRMPVVASTRITYTFYPRAYYPIERLLGHYSERVIATSRAAAQHLITQVGIPKTRVVVIPNGVDTDLFNPSNRGHPEFRERWSLGDAFVALAPGRLVGQKDHAAVIDGFSLLIAKRPSSILVIAGSGPLERELKRRAADIAASVRFVGELTRPEMAEAMAAADVMCLMSHWEGMPNVVLEAMASGVAVLASAVDGTRELLEGSGGGLLVPEGAHDVFAARLLELSASPALRVQLGLKGRRAAEENHSLDVNVDRHAALYERVIRSRYPNCRWPSP